MIASLAVKSLYSRRFAVVLTAVSIALAVALLLAVERIRAQSRESFAGTISGTDLIVGARNNPIHLLLFSIFGIGNATNNLSWNSYRTIAEWPEVAWTIPLMLGDSHRGYRVLGTTVDYLEHFRFGRAQRLEVVAGRWLAGSHDTVLGADVARNLGYRLGQEIIVAHGSGDVALALHRDQPFRVVGVLARTGTPVDRTIHVSLEGFGALHARTSASAYDPLVSARRELEHHERGQVAEHDDRREALSGEALTALLVGMKSRAAALSLQRRVSEFRDEPLTAILPGATLLEIWSVVGIAERALLVVAVLVVIVGLAGMMVALLTSLGERRREMAILRSVGARPAHVFALILGEATFITLLGIVLGAAIVCLGLLAGRPWFESELGLYVDVGWPSPNEWGLMLLSAVAGALIGIIPAYRIYRHSLADGMAIRL